VTDDGWYADLPDGIVRKISIHAEIADLHHALSDLVAAPESFSRMGLRAQAHLHAGHAPTLYVQGLARALEAWPRLMIRHARRRLLQRMDAAAPSRGYRLVMGQRARHHMPFDPLSGR
jgi:hypothetical protein